MKKTLTITSPRKVKIDRPANWKFTIWHNGEESRQFRTSREIARKDREEMLKSYNRGRFVNDFPEIARKLGVASNASEEIRWREGAELYLADLEERNCRQPYINAAKDHLTRAGDVLRNPILDRLHPDKLRGYIIKKGRTEKSRATLRSTLVAFLSWCGECGWCEKRLFHGIKWRTIRKDDEPPVFLTLEEVKLVHSRLFLFKGGTNQGNREVDLIRTNRLRAAFAVATLLGIRPGSEPRGGGGRAGELPQLKFSDFNLREKSLLVPSRVSKTRKSRLIQNLPDAVVLLLKAGRYRADDYLLPVGYRTFRQALKDSRDRVLQETGIRVKWCQKILRHTFATFGFWRGLEWCIAAGGWIDSTILARHYKGLATAEESEEFFAADLPSVRRADRFRYATKKAA